MPLETKVAMADHVIDTSDGLVDTRRRTDELLRVLCREWDIDATRYRA
jgi:dephospho-CoA kinase